MLRNDVEDKVHVSPPEFRDMANAMHGRTTSSRGHLSP